MGDRDNELVNLNEFNELEEFDELDELIDLQELMDLIEIGEPEEVPETEERDEGFEDLYAGISDRDLELEDAYYDGDPYVPYYEDHEYHNRPPVRYHDMYPDDEEEVGWVFPIFDEQVDDGYESDSSDERRQ